MKLPIIGITAWLEIPLLFKRIPVKLLLPLHAIIEIVIVPEAVKVIVVIVVVEKVVVKVVIVVVVDIVVNVVITPIGPISVGINDSIESVLIEFL